MKGCENMAYSYSTSKDINAIANNYRNIIANSADKDRGYAVAGLVGDMEIARMNTSQAIAEAEKQRNFEAEMSNTSYQRATADLEKAGLNPVLAAMNGGASTPNSAVGAVDTGATGSSSKMSDTTISAIVSRENARTSAQAQRDAAYAAASAQRYAADMAYKTAQLQIANPNNAWGFAREALSGATNGKTLGDIANNVVQKAKNLVGQVGNKVFGKTGIKFNTNPPKVEYGKSTTVTTFKTNSKQITTSSIRGFNTAYSAKLKLPNNNYKNITFNQFENYNQYLCFCAYFNLYALRKSDFNSLSNRYNGNLKIFR